MKQIFLYLLVGILVLSASCNQARIDRIKINKDWKFKRVDEVIDSEKDYNLVGCNDSTWEEVSLPHTAHLEPLVVNDQWQGICWYRKLFDLPKATHNKTIILELEAAMNHSKIWVNGDLVNVHQGGYLPIVVDLTKYLKYGEKNSIAIRLNNTDNPITGPKPLKTLDFNMYGGLYRNASLIIKDEVYISHPILADKVAGGGIFITTPKVGEELSLVNVKTHLVNDSDDEKDVQLIHTVYFKNQLIDEKQQSTILKAGADIELSEEFAVKDAQLWSPQSPNLYTLDTKVLVNGKVLDKQNNRFGIREFVFEGNDLFINGQKTYLRGTNRHQEYPYIGYALSDNAQYRDAKKIKEAGFDYVRLSHYPHSPAFMDACDELGLITIDAILGWQYYLDSDEFRNYCYRSAKELILRDRNHPSILAWEVSLNETKMPVFFMEELHRIVHKEYPSPTTYSCGWMNEVYDIFFQARQHRIMHHYDSIQPKPYMVSEYGDWEYHSKNPGLNQHKFNDILRAEKSSRHLRSAGEKAMLQQAYNWQESHNDNQSTPAYGDGYWVMYDYNRGYHDNIEASGVMDIFRLPKFGYYFFKSQRSPNEEDVLFIANYWTKESALDVRVFANCEEVKLYLNNTLIATQMPDVNDISNNLNHPPFTFMVDKFEAGELKAEGYINGKKVSEHIVKTPQKAVGLKIWVDESGKAPQANVNDVLFLHVAAIDINGTIVPDFNGAIQLDYKGDIEIINSREIKAEAGIATALIKIGEASANVTVNAKAKNLLGAKYSFEVHN